MNIMNSPSWPVLASFILPLFWVLWFYIAMIFCNKPSIKNVFKLTISYLVKIQSWIFQSGQNPHYSSSNAQLISEHSLYDCFKSFVVSITFPIAHCRCSPHPFSSFLLWKLLIRRFGIYSAVLIIFSVTIPKCFKLFWFSLILLVSELSQNSEDSFSTF